MVAGAVAAALLVGCSSGSTSTFKSPASGNPLVDASGNPPAPAADAATDATGAVFTALDGCTNLECAQVQCDSGVTTTVRGTVYDPAGKVPLYNVVVYVPNAPLDPLPSSGASCDRCGATVSGSPIVTALTDAKGEFVLTNVPAGADVPLVMQIGKWRREVTIPAVAPCAETDLTDPQLTRLPRNQSEGSIPRIAITTGGADPLECLLRKIGVDDAEFSTAGSASSVHLYAGGGVTETTPDGGSLTLPGASAFDPAHSGGVPFAQATALWSDSASLEKYDIVLMACEGQLNEDTKPPTARQALYDFENAGGRVFASHWHRYWFSDGPAPVPSVGTWVDRQDPAAPGTTAIGTVDTSFPKGQALADWLVNVGASTIPGQLPIVDSKHNLDGTDSAEAQSWISMPNPNAPDPDGGNFTAMEYMTFNTPIGVAPTMQCGRVVYSDLHVSSGDQTGQPFPSGCITKDLSPQEKALEFMLFDLSSCLQSDTMPPAVPR
jgi:hypothetical protein